MNEDIHTNPYPLTGSSSNAGEKTQQPSKMEESESNMEFAMIQSPEATNQGECIYAVVSKTSKNRSSALLSPDKVEYSKMGLNDSIRNKSFSSDPIFYTSQDVYSSIDDVAIHQENSEDQIIDKEVNTENHHVFNKRGTIHSISHRYKFPAVFLGSMIVDLNKLEKNKNEYLVSCIQSVAAQNSEETSRTLIKYDKMNGTHDVSDRNGNGVTLSTHRGMNVVIVLEGGHMKVKEKKSNIIRLDIPLKSIRMWGTGRSSSSREFAIISKDSSLQTELCRVFLCEVVARTVADIFKDICAQLSKLQKLECQAPEVKDSTESDSLKKAASVASFKGIETVRSSKSEGSKPSNTSSLKDLTKCYYLGMMEVEKPTGTKMVQQAIDLVHTYVSNDLWQSGKLLTTSDGLFFINDGNLGLSCPNSSLTYVGPSLKHKDLVGIIVRKNEGIFAHIFSIEADILNWFENMKFICKLHSTKFDKSVSSTLSKKKYKRS